MTRIVSEISENFLIAWLSPSEAMSTVINGFVRIAELLLPIALWRKTSVTASVRGFGKTSRFVEMLAESGSTM